MPDPFLLWGFSAHGVVFPLSLIGLYRYGDRTEFFAKAVGDSGELLVRIRGRVAEELDRELTPVFQDSDGEPSTVGPDDYSERGTNPIGSEAYREALFRFIEAEAGTIVDYGRTCRARRRWCSWARFLSWNVLALAFWEVLCVALFGGATTLFELQIPAHIVRWSFGPTAVLVVFFFVSQAILLRNHDVIHDSKNRYGKL
jgi:hypothetical protein